MIYHALLLFLKKQQNLKVSSTQIIGGPLRVNMRKNCISANKTNANAQLSLAMAWNRCDIARHEIFTQDNRKYWKVK